MNDLASGLILSPSHWAQMEADSKRRAPEEACGIVAGDGNQSRVVIPITNVLHSPVQFRMAPEEQLEAFLVAEKNEWEIIAIYHSHPHGIDAPSATDFQELTYPGIIYLIWYEKAGEWCCRAYLMNDQSKAEEVRVVIAEQ